MLGKSKFIGKNCATVIQGASITEAQRRMMWSSFLKSLVGVKPGLVL